MSPLAQFSFPPSGAGSADHAPSGTGRWARELVMALHPATEGCASCFLQLPSQAGEFPLEADFPVDVVYTWVNGSDPAHAAKRAAYLPRQQDIHPDGLELARFRDNEELRYSLRSLEAFAPWVRKVIILTDKQVPVWLNLDHPKILIADHTDCIPERYLPSFNAQVIEAYLHRIPDLAEHFIYFNDDFMLGRPCRKTDFFTPNGLPVAYVDWRWRRRFGYWWTKTPHACSYYNTLDLLQRRGVVTDPRFITAHGPYAQIRANVAAAWDFFQDFIEAFSVNTFRGTNEIGMYSHAAPLLMYGQKRVVPRDERYYYVQTRRRDRLAYYSGLARSRRDGVPPLFFCINDVGDENWGDWRSELRALMETYFPEPSSFERA